MNYRRRPCLTLTSRCNDEQNIFNDAKLCKRAFNEHVVPCKFGIPGRDKV